MVAAISSYQLNFLIEMNLVWVDGMDVPDLGLKSGRLLSLKVDGLSAIMDEFASGKFHNHFERDPMHYSVRARYIINPTYFPKKPSSNQSTTRIF
jgi:hypothetical protein